MALALRHLPYLLTMAEHGSFTHAAEDLRISQPTLSQQIKQMERTLGVQLLDRTGRTVQLTDVGETYARHTAARCGTWRPPNAPSTMFRTSPAATCASLSPPPSPTSPARSPPNSTPAIPASP
ncbi:hypothetical protein GCM10010493_77590 [Streptomyces lavendulae subsp. grasserius]